MVSHISVGRPHAVIASTGETRAPQSKTQSKLLNTHSENFIPVDEKKWKDIPAYDDVKGRTLGIQNFEVDDEVGTPS